MVPNTHHSFFPISHLCVLTCITWKLQVIYGHSAYRMTALLLETFLVWFRVAWEIRLESYMYRPRHASGILWYNIACIYCQPVHTLLFGAQLHVCMTTKLTGLMTAYFTPNNSFAANNVLFYTNKIGYLHYTLQCLSNYSCTLLLKLLSGTTVYASLWVCRQATHKKEGKVRIKFFSKNQVQVGMGL